MNNHPPPPMPPPGAYAPAAGLISAVGAPYRRYADAILGGRNGLEESLLFAAAGASYPASAAVPAHLQGGGDTTGGVLLEERLLRLHDAHSRVLTNEVAARALQDQVSAAQQQNNQQALQYQASAQQQQQVTAQRNHDLNLANSIERIMAQQEVQVQEHRLREQLVGEQHQQAVARAAWGGGTGGIGLGGINLLARRAAALSGDGSSYAHNLQLAEAVALRERHQRALEEEAVRLQHNQELRQQLLHQQQPPQHFGAGAGSAGDAAEQQHHLQQNGGLSHLLQNKHIMSYEELIRLRDGLGLGVSSRVGAGIPSNDSLFERQLMDAHILLSGGGIGGVGAGLSRFQQPGGERAAALAAFARLPGRAGGDEDFINQAYLDALIAQRVESVSLGGQQPAVNNGNDGNHHRQAATVISAAYPPSVGGGGSGQSLRYFNNGKEVDMEGNPLQPSNDNKSGNGDGGGGACGNGDSVILSNRSPGHPLDSNANAAAPMDENNAITRFLHVVVNRVPEIGPALAVIQREGNNPNVVDATMTVLRSIQERWARATDEITLDLHRRITGWYVDSPH